MKLVIFSLFVFDLSINIAVSWRYYTWNAVEIPDNNLGFWHWWVELVLQHISSFPYHNLIINKIALLEKLNK